MIGPLLLKGTYSGGIQPSTVAFLGMVPIAGRMAWHDCVVGVQHAFLVGADRRR